MPTGFAVGGIHCGVKSDPGHEDLALVVSHAPAVAAGVYTQNQFPAAPVLLDRARTPSDAIRVVVINSGNANAGTGPGGVTGH